MRLFLPFLLIIVSLSSFFVLTKPKLDAIRASAAEVGAYEEALGNATRLNSIRDSLLARYNQFPSEGAAQLEKLVPDTIDNVRLIIDLNGIARDRGMQFKNLRVTSTGQNGLGAAPGGKKFDAVSISFSVSTTYDEFRRLVVDLERSLRIMDVTSLSFVAGDKGIYDFTVGLKTYWLR